MGVEHRHDYSVTFLDCQDLELLQEKLLMTSKVIDTNLAVARGCAAHIARLVNQHYIQAESFRTMEVENYINQLETSARRIKCTIEQSDRISNLVSLSRRIKWVPRPKHFVRYSFGRS